MRSDEAGVLERVISFVTNREYKKSFVVALTALSSMLYEPLALQRVSAIPDNGKQADAPLINVLGMLKNDSPEVKVAAMSCIQAAAHDADNRRILRDFRSEDAIGACVCVSVSVSLPLCLCISLSLCLPVRLTRSPLPSPPYPRLPCPPTTTFLSHSPAAARRCTARA